MSRQSGKQRGQEGRREPLAITPQHTQLLAMMAVLLGMQHCHDRRGHVAAITGAESYDSRSHASQDTTNLTTSLS